jgi:competence protein ComK
VIQLKILANYLIDPNSAAIIPMLEKEDGLTCVIEKEQLILVNLSPVEIVKESLNYYSFNSKRVNWSGKLNMRPIAINSQLNLFWFPCISPSNRDNIWFSVTHIIDTKPKGENLTDVYLSYGHIVTVNMNIERFDRKYERALRKRNTLNERIHSPERFCINQPSGFQICRNPGKDYYVIRGAEKE